MFTQGVRNFWSYGLKLFFIYLCIIIIIIIIIIIVIIIIIIINIIIITGSLAELKSSIFICTISISSFLLFFQQNLSE